jgi:peptide deformylase
MLDTMRATSAVGVAAPQVGVSLRVIVIQIPGEEEIALVNPEIVKRRGERLVEEGCLSVPGYQGQTKRSASVTVKGLDRQGKEVRLKAEGLLAQALEHEIDHLSGILYLDRLANGTKLVKVEPQENAKRGM